MKNAAIYTRYSSDAQKETSIEDQIRDCMKFAEDNSYRIVKIYRDEAISGKTDERKAFQQMISDSSKGTFESVIVWKLDRFARNRNESALNKVKLKKNGVNVVSAMEHIPDGPEGIILESVLEGMAEYYVYDLVEKTNRGRLGVALQCKHTGGRPLLGYKVNPDQTYAIDEYNADTVRQIFKLYAAGSSYSQIIDEMNRQGRKTAAGKNFGKNSLHELLRNERFIGVYTYNRIPSEKGKRNSHASKPGNEIIRIPGGLPAIIDEITWRTVQNKMESRRQAPARNKAKIDYLLSGKLFCGECGGAMVGQSSGNHERYSYYECNTKKRLRTCKKTSVKKETIEQAVIDYTIEYILSDKFQSKIVDFIFSQKQEQEKNDILIDEIKDRIKKNQIEINNIMNAIKAGIFTSTTKQALEELEDNAKQLQRELLENQTMKSPDFTKEAVAAWLKKISEGVEKSERAEKTIFDTLISSVYVYDDNTVSVIYRLSDEEHKISLSDLNGADNRI